MTDRAVALLMAGGQGLRMGGVLPKPLISALGVPLIERNLLALLAQGFRRLAVSSAAARPEVTAWAQGRGRALVEAIGGELHIFEESHPRGTLGAAAQLRGAACVVVQCADNLTAISFADMVAHHRAAGADMTVASHDEPFTLPFGRLQLDGARIVAYDEKPTLPIPISSGAYVLGPAALQHIPTGGRRDTPDVVRDLIAAGGAVSAFRHASPWLDVNTPEALRRAVARVKAEPTLEQIAAPELEVVGAVITAGERGPLLEWRPEGASTYAGRWDTPGGKIEPGEAPAAAIARELEEELGWGEAEVRPLCVFDDLDVSSGRWVRHHVFTGAAPSAPRAREGQRVAWSASFDDEAPLAAPARRALAYLEAAS